MLSKLCVHNEAFQILVGQSGGVQCVKGVISDLMKCDSSDGSDIFQHTDSGRVNVLVQLMASRHSLPKNTCCISQLKGLKIIAAISCIFGTVMVTVSSAFVQHEDPDSGETLVEEFSGDPIYESVWTQIIGASQVLVSLWMVYAKGSKLSCQIWTVTHIGAVAFIGFYLWNLSALIHQTFYYQLYLTFLGIDLCITAFMILVVIEIIIHPMPLVYESPEKMSSNLRKPI
ncbi:unnamed protein product [Allacma fusca]|uniref:Uncharacterized protein n=1 Tax=Allacma fusca TaxID=39272 RepID=A0A8J2JXI8_9HEXA|nr:unnamed protein product [Allacma fusca]